jgi:NADH-quinone oxidoreductase subunit F
MAKVLFNEPSPLETKVLSKRFTLEGSETLDVYLATDGWKAFLKAKEMTAEAIVEEVKTSALRGRGGAGFPTGLKWSFVPRTSPKPKVLVVNADESEPGTCKDRLLIEYDPHQLIEGIAIASLAVDAHVCYIYIRGEYRYLITKMERAVDEAYARGYLGDNVAGTGWKLDIHVHTGAGAYECGEETALLDSLEGKRGVPRMKPPFPAVAGAWAMPTLLNNVETFSAVPAIIRDGGAAFAALGTPKNGGTRLVCISGHVNKPGVYELPLGYPMLKAIYDLAGGIPGNKKLKAVVPGGSSCPILKAEECDIAMDYDTVAKAGSMLGSGGMVVLDETTDMVKFALRVIRFYAHESCGWCIPCREGTTWLRKILQRFYDGHGRKEDIPMIAELSKNMLGRTFCALGDAAAMPTISIIEKFTDEFEQYLARTSSDELVGIGR